MTTKLAGIDLGNSRVKVAIPDATGNPTMLSQASGELNLPSVVCFDKGRVIVGIEALNAAPMNPTRCAANWKRHMGSDTILCTDGDGTPYRARDIARILLSEVARNHEAQTGQPLRDVAISVPANYDDRQKHETKESAEAVGLNVVNLPHEPSAAFLGNWPNQRPEGHVLVIDVGGGTSDYSLVESSGNNMSVVGTTGQPDLGGQDFNARLEEDLLTRFENKHGLRPSAKEHPLELQDLRQRIEQLKITLSTRDEAPIFVSCAGHVLNTVVTRAEFESLTRDLVERAMAGAQQTLSDAGVEPSALSEILLVGGACKMPLFAEMVEKVFGRKPSSHADPDYAAAKGNVIAARIELEREGLPVIVGGRKIPPLDLHTRDVTSHPIGIKAITDDRKLVNSVILGKGAPIPSDRTEPFLLAERGQTGALIELLQGPDGAPAEKCLQLGHFELTDLDAVDGDHRIDIRLKIDRNGMLSATAYDPNSGRSADLSIDYRRAVGSDKPARRKAPA